MSAGLIILLIALDIAAAAVLVYWGVGLLRLIRTIRGIPTARHGIAMSLRSPPAGAVCLIIPAHNEAGTIGGLIGSLKAQTYNALSVVLCLDRCTDATAAVAADAIAGDPRFAILPIASCPDGWAGKVNAVWAGVQTPAARRAEFLLFADADTTFDPQCTAATVALLQERGLDLLSLLSTLSAKRWFELLVQPAAGMELVRQYPLSRANRMHRRRAFANGQFMLFRREAYDAIGGHGAVHDELLEDLALSRAIAAAERPAGVFLADGMLKCRMYDSWVALRAGWKRIYIESAKRKVKRLRKAALVAALLGGALPSLATVNIVISAWLMAGPGEAWPLGVAGLAVSLAAIGAFGTVVGVSYRIARVPLWAAPGFPIGSLLLGAILAEAARDLKRGVPTRWAGRDYIRTPR